jgi:hypothetical protein
MINGFDECYPVTMLDTLLAELESLKAELMAAVVR